MNFGFIKKFLLDLGIGQVLSLMVFPRKSVKRFIKVMINNDLENALQTLSVQKPCLLISFESKLTTAWNSQLEMTK